MKYNKIDWIKIKRLFNSDGWVEFKKYIYDLDMSLKDKMINLGTGDNDNLLKEYHKISGSLFVTGIVLNIEDIAKNIEEEDNNEK